jgi:hypothetical protein
MNNTFNINRFGLLLKRQWLDFGKNLFNQFWCINWGIGLILCPKLNRKQFKIPFI